MLAVVGHFPYWMGCFINLASPILALAKTCQTLPIVSRSL